MSYSELWDIPSDVYELLQYFRGEKAPKIENQKDKRRVFANEFSQEEHQLLLQFFQDNPAELVIVS